MSWLFGKFKSRKKTSLLAMGLSNLSKGFTLLELIVVIAIFLIITAVVIADIPNFRDKSALDLIVSEIATYIRGAQVYSSAQLMAEQSSLSYYVAFTKGSSDFSLYRDNNLVESYRINGFLIDGILLRKNSAYNCSYSAVNVKFSSNTYSQSIGSVSDASVVVVGEPEITDFEYLDLRIKGSRNQNLVGCLRVYHNGQITNVSCDSGDSFDRCS